MEVIAMIITISTLLNAVLAIINFIQKAKKPVDSAIDKKFEKVLEPVNEKLTTIDKRLDKLDKNECMNYLVDFIEDSKNGIPKDEIQKKRASEVFDHYTKELHGNSYIHDGWIKYVK